MSLLGRLARKVLRTVGDVPTVDVFSDLDRLLSGRKVRTVLDVGACFGEYSLRFARRWPEARVIAFEPNPETFEQLQTAVKGDPQVQTVPLGAFSKSGTRSFFLNSWAGACSLLDRPQRGPAYHSPRAVHVDQTEVPVVRLDEWAAEQGLDGEIDLLKLDIQGAELEALKGAEALLPRVGCILSEVHFYANYEGACLLDELWAYLRSQGFTLYQLYSEWGARDGQLVQGDALFIRDDIRTERLGTNGKPFQAVKFHL